MAKEPITLQGVEHILNVYQISEHEGLKVNLRYEEGQPDLGSEDGRIVGRPNLQLQADRDGDRVQLTGHVKAAVAFECDRCLKPLSVQVDQNFDLLYTPPIGGGAPEEKELGVDDLSTAFYQGQGINLDDLVREQVVLTLPMGRLCGEECRGLCPECGANLNEGKCACKVEQVDPRWAALKELKTDN
ncbi:MAG TPA: DUF177 domain-containing protein [Blastocatellia bacterium]|nr:DUF177 domain-containing protein [Blastocatellia bacterium]